jgi:hypothetical protein
MCFSQVEWVTLKEHFEIETGAAKIALGEASRQIKELEEREHSRLMDAMEAGERD